MSFAAAPHVDCRTQGRRLRRHDGRHRSRRPGDPRRRERLVALVEESRRFGYRRVLVFLRREGIFREPSKRLSVTAFSTSPVTFL
jgi:hypothetical protein